VQYREGVRRISIYFKKENGHKQEGENTATNARQDSSLDLGMLVIFVDL